MSRCRVRAPSASCDPPWGPTVNNALTKAYNAITLNRKSCSRRWRRGCNGRRGSAPSGLRDHELTETVDRLQRVGQAVSRQAHLHPRHADRDQLVEAGQIGIGVEVGLAWPAAHEVAEADVDRRPVPTGRIHTAAQVLSTLTEAPDRVHLRRPRRLG